MQEFKREHQKRASAILKSVEGLSIAEAQWLLGWCSEYLLNALLVKWDRQNVIDPYATQEKREPPLTRDGLTLEEFNKENHEPCP